jgi:hypothetical protein
MPIYASLTVYITRTGHIMGGCAAALEYLDLNREDRGIKYSTNVVKPPPKDQEKMALVNFFLKNAINIGSTAVDELIVLGNIYKHGPKIYRPSCEECLAYEEIELSLPAVNYAQPFPTFAIELPRNYSKMRSCEGTREHHSPTNEQHAPIAVITHVQLEAIFTALLFNTGLFIVGHGDLTTGTVDEAMQMNFKKDDVNETEDQLFKWAMRIAGNACLLLVDRGCKRLGHTNEKHARKLQEGIAKAGKTGQDREAMTSQYKALPVLYGFSQEVSVRMAIGHAPATSTPTGRKVSPHWRCAHWRMQRFGHELSQQKRILIPHVMVNKDHFAGTTADTTAAYRRQECSHSTN